MRLNLTVLVYSVIINNLTIVILNKRELGRHPLILFIFTQEDLKAHTDSNRF